MPKLIDDIEAAAALQPTLWWLGGCGFAIKYRSIVFYVDPGELTGVSPADITNADMLLRTHAPVDGYDPGPEILAASPRAKMILPKSCAEAYAPAGVPLARMTTTDSGLRVEYFKAGVYGRVYSVPAARDGLAWTPIGGYPYLGYLIRFGETTIYHAGSSRPYEGLAAQLRPYDVTVAILPVGPDWFSVAEAAQLAENSRARWLLPVYRDAEIARKFTDHLLGHRPAQKFKILDVNESWSVPVGDEREGAGDRVF